ncbi:MAG: toxin-antitoxin system HicB family antitoxin [Actinomycetota bacterium]
MVTQLIARIDEKLHARLKARAAAEGRSLNALVGDLLSVGLSSGNERARMRIRVESAGLGVVPRPGRRAPSRDVAIASTRGAGRAASEALAAERASR